MAELTTFREGKKTFLAVGFIEDRGYSHDQSQYLAVNAQNEEYYTDSYIEAMEHISAGLVPPKITWTL